MVVLPSAQDDRIKDASVDHQHPILKTIQADPITEHPRAVTRSFLCVLGGAVCIGFAPIFVRLSEVGPVATAFWRMTLSLPLIWLALGLNGHREPGSNPSGKRRLADWWPVLVTGLFFAADLAAWHWSLHFTTVANSTLLANFAPVFVVLFGWAVFGQRVSRRFLLAMGVALAGTCLLIGRDFQLDRRALLGDALSLVTGVFLRRVSPVDEGVAEPFRHAGHHGGQRGGRRAGVAAGGPGFG